jgi:exopolysaccharide biosynthesis polyprenyl glycosylphosphotransferase
MFVVEVAVIAIAARLGWGVGADPGAGLFAMVASGVCVAAVPFAFYWADLYDLRVASWDVRRGRRLLMALGGLFGLAVPVTLLAPAAVRSGIPFALAGAALGAAALRAARPWRLLRRRVLALGQGESLRCLLRELSMSGDDQVVGILRAPPDDLVDRVRGLRAEVVVVAFDDRRGVPPDDLLRARLAGVPIVDACDYLESTCRKVPIELLRPARLIYGDGFVRSAAREAARRALSVTAAAAIALLTVPAWLAILIAIKVDSRGPIFYRQTRVGRGGRTFLVWKFRTMTADAEAKTGPTWARANDPRVTRVGAFLRKSRLDELPQLLNVIAGDMDLVGPRPERPEFVAELQAKIPYYDLRSLVRPGLTGWAQIRYPYGASVEDARQKLSFDLYYVKHASPILDAIVLFHTAKVVVTGRGAR